MRVSIIKNTQIMDFILPTKVYGNYQITDINDNGDSYNLINVEAVDGSWILKSNDETKIIRNNAMIESSKIENYRFYLVRNREKIILLYVTPIYDSTFEKYILNSQIGKLELAIGNGNNNNIIYNSNLISETSFLLLYENDSWSIKKKDSSKILYVNNLSSGDTYLNNGDTVFIYGLKITVLKNMIVINNPEGLVNTMGLIAKGFEKENSSQSQLIEEHIENVNLYKDEDYFLKSPRLRNKIEKFELIVDAPPAKESNQEVPMLYTLGPMLTMGMTSIVSLGTALDNMSSGKQTWDNCKTTVILGISMLATTILWPFLTQAYNKVQKIKREHTRQKKYKDYIETRRQIVIENIKKQKQILEESYISTERCCEIIMNKENVLWERKIDQDDFLSLRVGRGNVPLEINIKYPEEHFTIEDDNLRKILATLVDETKVISDVPLSYPFAEKNITAIIGKKSKTRELTKQLLIQLMTFYSFDEVKLVILTDKKNDYYWKPYRFLPHMWSNDKSLRFFSTDEEELREVSNYLEKEFYSRKYKEINGNITEISTDYKKSPPYYVILTDQINLTRDSKIVQSILEEPNNLGFSLIILNDRLSSLPNQCSNFIDVGDKTSGILSSELISDKQKEFNNDVIPNFDIKSLVDLLANIPIEFAEKRGEIPDSISFLEMYQAGKVEQLNSLNRWKINDPTKSLGAPIGIDANGGVLSLDLHEKYHGPHGLIAGMTGSGKSEFIITYILSMAVNYSPNEVSFVLIDYKGGGLAGAFQNKELGIKLPHLAGTITNLDTVELNRSLASIESELRRRQIKFNQARDELGESTIDIYKYQKLYREGKLKEPISHLFIICDEFAELKTQQPDFMEHLISTARIGRSLGVHLILATQKPSGVVNDQIWSNSKFRVCLKVQEKSDSMEVIKRPDAASLRQVGRFYLQVGYNEMFAIGQSAWCGAQYYASDILKKQVDKSINMVNEVGEIIKSVDPEIQQKALVKSNGEELPNILNYVTKIAKEEHIFIPQLWLDRISNVIYVENIKQKYNYKSSKYEITPVIGEFDDPNNQRQGILKLPLSAKGNTIIYGMSGSGKSNLLTTIVYSSIIEYSPKEINLYLLDFDAEILRMFENAPQVGDVVYSSDDDKIRNLIKQLRKEIEIRKKLFTDFNGEFNYYNLHSGKIIPLITIIISNYENFVEMYTDYEDELIALTREGFRYGIVFIITVSTANVKYRLKQNFNTNLVLQMSDEMDYATILGCKRDLVPSKYVGRGLTNLEDTFEFQTAFAYKDGEINDYIKVICSKLNSIYKITAPTIPVLPEIIKLETILTKPVTLSELPLGISKDNLEVETYDFSDNVGTPILAQDINLLKNFSHIIIKQLQNIKTNQVIVIDAKNLYSSYNDISIYCNKDFDKYIDKIIENLNVIKENPGNYGTITCVIAGIDKLKLKILSNKLDELIETGKQVDNFKLIVVDTAIELKKSEYDNWYKTMFTNLDGIWLGNGVSDQNSLRISKLTKEMRDSINDNFAWVIENSVAKLIKVVERED